MASKKPRKQPDEAFDCSPLLEDDGLLPARSQVDERLARARKTLSDYLATSEKSPPRQAAPSGTEGSGERVLSQDRRLRADSLRLLAQREHSADELRRKLAWKQARRARLATGHSGDAELAPDEPPCTRSNGSTDAALEAVLTELARLGWQSDQRYAEVMLRRLAGQVSQRMIRERLMQAGVSREDIERAWLALPEPPPDDEVAARMLWERRYGEAPGHEKERQRQIRFLLGRGFGLSLVLRIVPRVCA